LVWRKGGAAVEALREAHISAEQAANQRDKDMNRFWLNEQLV
jgi:hypothetical protein